MSTTIHRFLDETFAGTDMTPELQDLKEELRGNLSARLDELTAAGVDPQSATETAIRELGDVRALIDDASSSDEPAAISAYRVNRVRPRAAFVVRTVLLSLALAAAAVLIALGALHVLDWSLAVLTLLGIVAGVAGGIVTADALRQETTQHYPVPRGRAVLYGVAAGCGLAGLASIALYIGALTAIWLLIAGIVLALVALIGLVSLGVTQTNRTKQWVFDAHREMQSTDAFSADPMAAARFGIYTVVVWILAIAAFVLLSLTVGFLWSWLALLAGVVVFFLLLARMLFRSDGHKKEDAR